MARICSVKDCQGPSKAKGLCSLHYERQRLLAAPLCSVAGCSNHAEKRRLCGKHYFRLRIHGDPLAGRTFNGEAEKFIFEFADPKTDECIIWPFSLNTNGYPAAVGDLGSAHRAVCQLFHGDPPSEIHETAHSCGNRPCINPGHLRWALPIENEADKILYGRTIYGEKSGSAKLTNEQVISIRLLFGSMSNKSLGRTFGVSAANISVIGNRKTWKHI